MSLFHNPYQFIRVRTHETKTLSWPADGEINGVGSEYVRHDYWHESGYSGTLSATLTALSPLVIGGQQTQGSKQDKTTGTVTAYRNAQGQLAIPGNSLRGMISHVAEIISGSAMRVLDTQGGQPYSVRMQPAEAYKAMGLLYVKDGERFIYPIAENPNDFDSLGSYNNASDCDFLEGLSCFQAKHNRSFHSCKPIKKSITYEGIHFIRGRQDDMNEVHHEKCLQWDGNIHENKLIPVPDNVIQALEHTLKTQYEEQNRQRIAALVGDAEPASLLPKGYEKTPDRWVTEPNSKTLRPRLLPGDLVYFKCTEAQAGYNREVTHLGFSAIGRRVAEGTLATAFQRAEGKNALPWGSDRTELTPAECLFGVVEETVDINKTARSLASRLRFYDAPGTSGIEQKCLGKKILKILNSPKPPSPSMYFSANDQRYISKGAFNLDTHRPNGRKCYLPHHPETPQAGEKYRFETQLEGEAYRPWMHSACEPLDTGACFTVQIRFDNLHQAELDLLYFCLQPDKRFIHRLGLGKPLGLGHVRIDDIQIQLLNRRAHYTPESLQGQTMPTLDYTFDRERAYQPQEDAPVRVNKTAVEQLIKLGSLDAIRHPVCYPYHQGSGQTPYNEDKGYEWFTENDSAVHRQHNGYDGQYLRALDTDNAQGQHETIPTLDSQIPGNNR